jgi:hypothetical protein
VAALFTLALGRKADALPVLEGLALVVACLRTRSRALATSLVTAADQTDDATLAKAAADALRPLGIDPDNVRELAADTGATIGQRQVDDVLALIDQRRGDRAVERSCSCRASASPARPTSAPGLRPGHQRTCRTRVTGGAGFTRGSTPRPNW